MTGIVWIRLGDIGDALAVLDAERRVYVAASRDGSYLHLIGPSQQDVANPETGELLRRIGDLVCTCKGFAFHGHCYRADQAIAFEAGEADRAAAPAWLHDGPAWLRDAAPGELVEAYGK